MPAHSFFFRFGLLIRYTFEPLQGVTAMLLCVCLSVKKISQTVFKQSTLFLVETFPLAQGCSDSIFRKSQRVGVGGPKF